MRYRSCIDPSFTPEELNSTLLKNFGYGLINFASGLASSLGDALIIVPRITRRKKILGATKSSIKNEIEILKVLKNYVLAKLDEFMRVGFYSNINSPNYDLSKTEERTKYLKKWFKLHPFFSVIDNEVNKSEEQLSMFPKNLRGRKYFDKYWIASIWSLIICSEKGIHWLDIVRLFRWFLKHFNRASYIKKIEFHDFYNDNDEADFLNEQCKSLKKKHLQEFRIIKSICFPLPPKTDYIEFIQFYNNSIEIGINFKILGGKNYYKKFPSKYWETLRDPILTEFLKSHKGKFPKEFFLEGLYNPLIIHKTEFSQDKLIHSFYSLKDFFEFESRWITFPDGTNFEVAKK